MKIFDPQKKVLCNIDKVYDFFVNGNTFPVLVEIDPSNICNHNCSFCLSKHINRKKDRKVLPESMLVNVCKELKNNSVRAVTFTGGGEPTVNEYLSEAINELECVDVGLFTNGSLLHHNNFISNSIHNIKWIRICIDAACRETYLKIHGVDHWGQVWDNIHSLFLRSECFTLGVGFIITPDNYNEIIKFAELVSQLPVDYCQYKPEIKTIEDTHGIQHSNKFWNDDVVPKLVEAKKILKEKFQINLYKLNDLLYGEGREYQLCLGSQLQPCIGADGLVYICPNFRGYPEYSYGSLYDKCFVDIWNDIDIRRKLIKKIDNENFCNCTPLCKPHESNKMMWELWCDYKNALSKRRDIMHWRFI